MQIPRLGGSDLNANQQPQGIRSESGAHVQGATVSVYAGGQWLNYVLQGLVLIAVGFLVIDQYVLESGAGVRVTEGSASLSAASSSNVKRTEINLGVTEPIGDTGLGAQVTFSRDGRRLAYAAQVDGVSQLYLRDLDQLEARLVPGTQGAQNPFFSPDGEWVAFYDDLAGILKKVTVNGGSPQALADALTPTGGAWIRDDTIVFGTGNAASGRKLFTIPATGGTPEILISPEPESGHVFPEVLPGGEALLITVKSGIGGNDAARVGRIAVASLATNEIQTLIEPGYAPRYSPTGHILFVRAGDLWAVPFDAQRLEKTGPEVLVISGVQQDGQFGGAAYAISSDGMLVYLPGGDTSVVGRTAAMMWVDRNGGVEPLDLERAQYMVPQVSPDGERVATVLRTDDDLGDILIIDLIDHTRRWLTNGQGPHYYPRWTHDGESLVYWWNPPDDEAGLFRQAVDGTGLPERLIDSDSSFQQPHAIAEDGSWIVFQNVTPNDDFYLLTLDGNRESQPLLNGPYNETDAVISPDERWIAFASDETGQPEIYIRPFPNVGGGTARRISDRGGIEPLWSPDGSELFFRNGASFFSVSVQTEGAAITWGAPEQLFAGLYMDSPGTAPNYDIHPDGERFLVLDESSRSTQQAVLIAVENWFEELNRLAPASE